MFVKKLKKKRDTVLYIKQWLIHRHFIQKNLKYGCGDIELQVEMVIVPAFNCTMESALKREKKEQIVPSLPIFVILSTFMTNKH